MLKAMIDGKVREIEMVDAKYDMERELVEVSIVGTTVYAVIPSADLIYKVSAKLTRQGRQDGEYVSYNVEVTTPDAQLSELVFDKIENKLSDEMDELEFTGCPWEEDSKYGDSFSVEYEHGVMGEIDKQVRSAWKEIKKELGLK